MAGRPIGGAMNFDFAELLLEVVARRASDLHIVAGAPPMIRVRGRLTGLEDYPRLTPTDTREVVYSILTNDQRQRLETDWQIDFAYSVPGHARFRVNAYMQRAAIGAAFRLIPATIQSIEDLGLPAATHEFINKPRGIVLVTGPTGSGKSTSLAAMIDAINQTREEHILTIEDPIEFLHSHKRCIVNQREIGADAEDFASALKAALREDPDVIREGKTHQIYSAIQTSGSIGMQTMDAHLAQLVRSGRISRKLAEQRASVPEELKRLLGPVQHEMIDPAT